MFKIKKIMTYLLVVTLISSYSTPLLIFASNDETSSELQEQIDETNNQSDEAQNELDEANSTIDELTQQTKQIQQDISDLETQIVETSNQIDSLTQQISDLETEIAEKEVEAQKLSDESSNTLVALQLMNNSNPILDSIFTKDGKLDLGKIFNDIDTIGIVSDNLVGNLDELLNLLDEITTLKEETEQAKSDAEALEVQLAEEKTSLEDKQAENEVLIEELREVAHEAEDHIEDLEQQTEDLKQQQEFLEAAGCGPDDVYGIDCAVPEPEPDNSSNSNSGGGSTTAPSSSGFINPVSSGVITNPYGYDGYDVSGNGFHKGVDIANSCGTPLLASAAGTVIGEYYNAGGYGYYLVLLHTIDGQNYVSLYAHMQEYYVGYGDVVYQGQQIGQMGTTGASTGCHTHFEIAKGSTLPLSRYDFEDPNNYIYFPEVGIWW